MSGKQEKEETDAKETQSLELDDSDVDISWAEGPEAEEETDEDDEEEDERMKEGASITMDSTVFDLQFHPKLPIFATSLANGAVELSLAALW
eukprot:g182.t1